jgi:ribosomal protein S18 acetylase RimI-like enzyme
MLRPADPADSPALVAIAAGTGVFKPHELVALQEVLDDYHAANREYGHQAHVWVEGGRPAGFVYLAPTAMTDRTWELWWIAVDVALHGRGLGTKLLLAVEDAVRAAGGRLLLIETSSTPAYDPTRRFYRKHGYAEAAYIPDFYADGDGKVIFSKRVELSSSQRSA